MRQVLSLGHLQKQPKDEYTVGYQASGGDRGAHAFLGGRCDEVTRSRDI